jgi:hypothetical protein
MPSTSAKQHRLMEAVAHGWHKPGGGGPSPAVAKKFAAADKGRSFANGGIMANKGWRGQDASFAAGGPVLGKTSQFLKTPDRFSKGMASPSNVPLADNKSDESWGKGSSKANPKGADKSEKPVLPRK